MLDDPLALLTGTKAPNKRPSWLAAPAPLLAGAVPLEGGIPLLMDGKIIGAIGVSGATSQQDGQCAKAGAQIFD